MRTQDGYKQYEFKLNYLTTYIKLITPNYNNVFIVSEPLDSFNYINPFFSILEQYGVRKIYSDNARWL